MKSINNALLLFSIILLAGACKRYTCPTYTSSLMIGTTPLEKYQLYPTLDSTSDIMRDDPTLSAPPVYTMFVKSDTSEEWVPTASLYSENYKAGKQTFWERIVFKLTPKSAYDKRMAEFELGRNKKTTQGVVYDKKRIIEKDEHMIARKVARVQWDRPTFHFEEEDTAVIFEEFADSTVSLADGDAVDRELMAIYNDTVATAVIPENEIGSDEDTTAIAEIDDPTILPANYPKYNIEQLMYESMFKAELDAWKTQGVNNGSNSDSTDTKFNLFGLFKKNREDSDITADGNEGDEEGFSNFDSFDEGFSESEEDYFNESIGSDEEEEENSFNIFKRNQDDDENTEEENSGSEEETTPETPSSSIE